MPALSFLCRGSRGTGRRIPGTFSDGRCVSCYSIKKLKGRKGGRKKRISFEWLTRSVTVRLYPLKPSILHFLYSQTTTLTVNVTPGALAAFLGVLVDIWGGLELDNTAEQKSAEECRHSDVSTCLCKDCIENKKTEKKPDFLTVICMQRFRFLFRALGALLLPLLCKSSSQECVNASVPDYSEDAQPVCWDYRSRLKVKEVHFKLH